MRIELTEEERVRAQQGQPIDVIDPQTKEAYVLIAKPQFEQGRSMAMPSNGTADMPEQQIPEGIRISQEAFRRDLPELLKQSFHWWAAYHRNERIGIAWSGHTLLDMCLKRGLADNEFYVGWIDPCELEVEEEIEPRLHHYEGYDDEDT